MIESQPSVYPQALPFAKDEVPAFLEQPLIAKLCTYNEDGTVHLVPIWFKYQEGEIIMGTQEITRKARNVKRDNRVAVMVDTQEPTLQGVIIYGTADLEYEDVIPKRISIFEKYVGAENAPGLAQRLASQWTPVIIRIKPKQIITFDYSKGFGISSDPYAETTEIA